MKLQAGDEIPAPEILKDPSSFTYSGWAVKTPKGFDEYLLLFYYILKQSLTANDLQCSFPAHVFFV